MKNTAKLIQLHQEECDKKKEEFRKLGIDGPWMNEPDRVEFKAYGLDCLLVRQPELFHWCGYVGVSPSHPEFGKNYNDVQAYVHGGLTYGEECRSDICHITEEEDKLFWFGFDCAHLGDHSPCMQIYRKTVPGWENVPSELSSDVYRDLRYVTEETKELARQLFVMTQSPLPANSNSTNLI